jgi:hypothetical protein
MEKLGLDAKLYRLSTGTRASWGAADGDNVHEGAAPSSLSEISNCADLTIGFQSTEANVTVRGMKGWTATTGANKQGPVEFNMVYDLTDANCSALLYAWLNNTSVACAVLDGDKATADVEGFWADFKVVKFQKSENNDGAQMVAVGLKPALNIAVPPEWIRVTSGS